MFTNLKDETNKSLRFHVVIDVPSLVATLMVTGEKIASNISDPKYNKLKI